MESATASVWPPGALVGGRYAVVRRITAGGMGEVYEGRDVKRDLPVALKRMVLDGGGSALERARRVREATVRMEREAIHTSRLGHPGIVNVLDLTYDADETPVVVMELLEGQTLDALLAYTPLPPRVAVDWIAQVLDALAVAHAHGVVHRDLKPANLFLVRDPAMATGVRVKILDFGVARVVRSDAPEGSDGDDASTSVTMANVFLGSFEYASPEQFDGAQRVTARSDLYAVGVILYRALTGLHPARTRALNDLMLRTLFGNIERSPRAVVPEVSEALDAVVQRALAHGPAQRFERAELFRDALVATLAPPAMTAPTTPPPSPAPQGPRRATSFALAAVAALGWIAAAALWALTR